MHIRIVCLLMGCFLCATIARAAFVSGVETFDGTTKDTTTWEYYDPLGVIAQNGKLTVNATQAPGTFEEADITTRSLRIGIGGFVQADVTVHSKVTTDSQHGVAVYPQVFLTNNSAGASDSILSDSAYLHVYENFFSTSTTSFIFGGYFTNRSNDATAFGPAPKFDTTYQLRIDRLSATSVKFTENGTSFTQTVPSNSAALCVVLVGLECGRGFR